MFARFAFVVAPAALALSFLASNASARDIVRCTVAEEVPAVSVSANFATSGGVTATSSSSYGNVCNNEYGVELTNIGGDSVELNDINATSVYALPSTASAVCPTMSMTADLWGYTAAGGWVHVGDEVVAGVYSPAVMFGSDTLSPSECTMTVNFKSSLLSGYTAAILGAHANQLAGDELPVTLAVKNVQIPQ